MKAIHRKCFFLKNEEAEHCRYLLLLAPRFAPLTKLFALEAIIITIVFGTSSAPNGSGDGRCRRTAPKQLVFYRWMDGWIKAKAAVPTALCPLPLLCLHACLVVDRKASRLIHSGPGGPPLCSHSHSHSWAPTIPEQECYYYCTSLQPNRHVFLFSTPTTPVAQAGRRRNERELQRDALAPTSYRTPRARAPHPHVSPRISRTGHTACGSPVAAAGRAGARGIRDGEKKETGGRLPHVLRLRVADFAREIPSRPPP